MGWHGAFTLLGGIIGPLLPGLVGGGTAAALAAITELSLLGAVLAWVPVSDRVCHGLSEGEVRD